jgi:ABC-type multidrug transport system ATPase subunit
MSIEVNNLLKVYGEQKAVNNISFKVDKGEIVGFLGPNGAGKSTTMKIITGYLQQDSGEAFRFEYQCHKRTTDNKKENWLFTGSQRVVLRHVCERIFGFYCRGALSGRSAVSS